MKKTCSSAGAEIRQVIKEPGRQYGDRAALGHPHLSPSIDESPERAIAFGQVNVFTARLGHGGGQFRVAERAGQREQPTHDPNDKDQGGRSDQLHHGLRHDENAAADDGADYDGDSAPQSEVALEFHGGRRGFGWPRCDERFIGLRRASLPRAQTMMQNIRR